jgi:hypothetical protein
MPIYDIPPLSYESILAELEFLGTYEEMAGASEEIRAVIARNSRRLELELWQSQYQALAAEARLLRVQRELG